MLFYVAITRAKQHLCLTYSNTRYRFGQLQQNDPSRFIDEIPDTHLDRSYAGNNSKNRPSEGWAGGSAYDRMHRKPSAPSASFSISSVRPATKEHVPTDNFIASDMKELREGHRVEHMKFGFGNVVKMEGASHNPIATIDFDQNGRKKIMLNYE